MIYWCVAPHCPMPSHPKIDFEDRQLRNPQSGYPALLLRRRGHWIVGGAKRHRPVDSLCRSTGLAVRFQINLPFMGGPDLCQRLTYISRIIAEIDAFIVWYLRSGRHSSFLPQWLIRKRITSLQRSIEGAREMLHVSAKA